YDHLQAHFLGYNQEENHEKQIYLNMLYKIVEIGIAHHQKQIILSRTAIEIKTTVGAIPHEMSCLFLHTNSITNKLFGPIFSAFKPDDQFIIRSPFKDGLDQ
ncbi:MAG: GNAT family N-acetyltransferase, partial [Saprospiraceae bacterium]